MLPTFCDLQILPTKNKKQDYTRPKGEEQIDKQGWFDVIFVLMPKMDQVTSEILSILKFQSIWVVAASVAEILTLNMSTNTRSYKENKN